MSKLSSVPKATHDRIWSGNSNLDTLNPQPGFSLFCQQPQEEGDTVTLRLTLRGFLFSTHSGLRMHVSTCACAYMFSRAAAVGSEAAVTVPIESTGYPCTLASPCTIPLPCSLGWFSGAPWQGEARDSTQAHSPPPFQGTFIPAANLRLLWFPLCRFNQPFLEDPDVHHTKGFNAHISFRAQSILWGSTGLR